MMPSAYTVHPLEKMPRSTLMEPGTDALLAGAAAIPQDQRPEDAQFGTATWALDCWQAMLAEILKE